MALICDNLEAFALRAVSARVAERSLDLQYCIWHADTTGLLLARGVQVRLLLDDLYVRGTDRIVGTLAAHPLAEVRLFDPFHTRTWGAFGAALECVFAAARLNHRMHNKAWIADGQLVMGGGRNTGDEYFGAAAEIKFRDLDLLIVGSGVAQALREFERYWASAQALPVEAFDSAAPLDGGLAELREMLDGAAESARAEPYCKGCNIAGDRAARRWPTRDLLVVDGDALRIVSDPPEKARGLRGGDLLDEIVAALGDAQRELLLISPHFLPGERGAEMLAELVRRAPRCQRRRAGLVLPPQVFADVTTAWRSRARYRSGRWRHPRARRRRCWRSPTIPSMACRARCYGDVERGVRFGATA